MSTKNVMQVPWVEFVIGVDHVIRGFDRALTQMSVGERSKLTFTPEYACTILTCSLLFLLILSLKTYYDIDGKEGMPPLIPPNSTLTFDLTLLGFRPRSIWVCAVNVFMC